MQKLSTHLCTDLYPNNTINPSSVTAAIASATAAATSATTTADPANYMTYPPCAVACVNQALRADCGTFSNTTCVCRSPVFFANITPCEVTTCPLEDLQTTLCLSKTHCTQPGVGGIGNREAQLAAFNATMGAAAQWDVSAFFDRLTSAFEESASTTTPTVPQYTCYGRALTSDAAKWDSSGVADAIPQRLLFYHKILVGPMVKSKTFSSPAIPRLL
ncbi:MAG: hypothetical protein Q9218_005616 [Villophora microphyllina]